MLEWFKTVERMRKDPRYPVFTFACPNDEVEEVKAYIKDNYTTFMVVRINNKVSEIRVDFSTPKN